MSVLAEAQLAALLKPYLAAPQELLSSLSTYLDLLVRWNARTNLTAIRNPEEMVTRHFGESLFAAQHLGEPLPETLLDLGSGAGFPGLPIALAHPGIAVTLAESQGKKSSFLREAIRTLSLKNVEVWARRAEALNQRFHTVTLRAVDDMAAALATAGPLASKQLLLLTTVTPELPEGFSVVETLALPGSGNGVLLRAAR
jgi:16S rRNA (guanine527-N7)-methyltransferase